MAKKLDAKLDAKLRAVRTTPEDEQLVMDLITKMEPRQGRVNFTLLVRMGLRKLAEAEGLR